jgi:protein phosphatase
MNYVLSSATHIGKRDGNEDSCFVAAQKGVFLNGAEAVGASSSFDLVAVVADGMGGGAFGEVASQIVVQTVRQLFAEGGYVAWAEKKRLGFLLEDIPGLLREVLKDIHEKVSQEAARRNSGKMGSTAVILLAKGDQYWFAHVGDSRLYHQDSSKQLSQCTTDHNMAAHGGKANQVYNILGCNSISPDLGSGTVSDGDVFFLCTDGITLSSSALSNVLSDPGMSPDAACSALVDLGIRVGGETADNATCIVIKAGVADADTAAASAGPGTQAPSLQINAAATPFKRKGNGGIWLWIVIMLLAGLGVGAGAFFIWNPNKECQSEPESIPATTNLAENVAEDWTAKVNAIQSVKDLEAIETNVPPSTFNRRLQELRDREKQSALEESKAVESREGVSIKHQVTPGDTLSEICRFHGEGFSEAWKRRFRQLNPSITNLNDLPENILINIPLIKKFQK